MADGGYLVALAVVGLIALAAGGLVYTAYSHGGAGGFPGMGGMGGMGGMATGMGGMMGGDDHGGFEGMGGMGQMGMGDGMCPHMEDGDMMGMMDEMMSGMVGMGPEAFDQVVEVYGTVMAVDGRLVVVQVENETITAFVAGMYVDSSNGYLVHGSWVAQALEAVVGGETTLTLAGHDGKYIIAGLELDGRSLLLPMLAGWG